MADGYTVTVSRKAAGMLAAHVAFLARVSPEAAENLRALLIREIRALEVMPESNPPFFCEGIPANKYRKRVIGKRYLLIFRVIGNEVYVDHVVDCRQDYRFLL